MPTRKEDRQACDADNAAMRYATLPSTDVKRRWRGRRRCPHLDEPVYWLCSDVEEVPHPVFLQQFVVDLVPAGSHWRAFSNQKKICSYNTLPATAHGSWETSNEKGTRSETRVAADGSRCVCYLICTDACSSRPTTRPDGFGEPLADSFDATSGHRVRPLVGTPKTNAAER